MDCALQILSLSSLASYLANRNCDEIRVDRRKPGLYPGICDARDCQVPVQLSNPAYFKFRIPPDICVYGFTSSHVLTGVDESDYATKTVIIDEGDVGGIEMAFFVFYNRSGGPVHSVKLIDYGPYYGEKSVPAVYGLIPLSVIIVTVGVTYCWLKKGRKR